ncbi:MAG: thioredoxin family protein [Alphaproteobacteria bacterium]|nr:thioredoxin family protein [Alphaproteobacteria bacterium]
MRKALSLIAAVLALAGPAAAQEANVKASLVPETLGVQPGGTVTVALRFDIREHWHTYWSYPGDSGEATAVTWTLPEGVTAGPLQFPYPERIDVGPLTNFGYENTVLHLTDIKVPATATPGSTLSVKADAVWLVCAEICIPEEADLALDIPVVEGAPPVNEAAKADFAATRAKFERPSPWPARFAVADGQLTVAVDAPELAKAGLTSAVLFPKSGGFIKNAGSQTVDTSNGELRIATEVGRRLNTPEKIAAAPPFPALLVVTGADGQTQAFAFEAKPGAAAAQPAGEGALSIWMALGFAFLGGLILNLMPCVFPVLSMKALALAQKGGDVRKARLGGLAYTAGVILSFVALAAAMLVLRGAGEAIAWGFQLQMPAVIVGLSLLFFAIGLNLMGVFEVGSGLQNLGARDTGNGVTGAFFTGVLAAVVATPCTAPFMAGAVGAAITQPAPIAIAIFAALGLGMAAPYLALTLSPALVRRLPRPGAWMVRLKQVLAFPMFGSAAWLLWVLSVQAGATALAAALAASVLAAFALWLWGLAQRGEAGTLARGAAVLAAAAVVAAVVLAPHTATTASAAVGAETSGPKSEAYSAARLESLLSEGKPVFVNLTAAWCVTCLVNEEVALSGQTLAKEFERQGVVYLKGDWTNRDAAITALLEHHGRAGVPLYLVYPAGSRTPTILPQILTETIVLDAFAPARVGS